MPNRFLTMLSVGLALLGASLAGASVAVASHDVVGLPHVTSSSSGQPYYGGQIQDANYTYYVTERDSAMNNWQVSTGRRYIDGWTSGETMTQYVVYSNSQQDTDLARNFGVPSCQSYNVTYGLGGYRSFHYGHDWNIGPLNRDRRYSVICLNVTAYGYSPGYDTPNDQPFRIRGMTHEMGHSLHLNHDSDGAMALCWCYGINTGEANFVNFIYNSAP